MTKEFKEMAIQRFEKEAGGLYYRELDLLDLIKWLGTCRKDGKKYYYSLMIHSVQRFIRESRGHSLSLEEYKRFVEKSFLN